MCRSDVPSMVNMDDEALAAAATADASSSEGPLTPSTTQRNGGAATIPIGPTGRPVRQFFRIFQRQLRQQSGGNNDGSRRPPTTELSVRRRSGTSATTPAATNAGAAANMTAVASSVSNQPPLLPPDLEEGISRSSNTMFAISS